MEKPNLSVIFNNTAMNKSLRRLVIDKEFTKSLKTLLRQHSLAELQGMSSHHQNTNNHHHQGSSNQSNTQQAQVQNQGEGSEVMRNEQGLHPN